MLHALTVAPVSSPGAIDLILEANGVAVVRAAGVRLAATGALGALGYAASALADRF